MISKTIPTIFHKKIKSILAFTLLEVALVLSIVVILFAISVPVAWPYILQNDLEVASRMSVNCLRRAQFLASIMKNDDSWGVKFFSDQIVIFQGSNYNSRILESDEVFNLTTNIVFSGPDEIIFQKFSGVVQQPQNISLGNSAGQSRDVKISTKGFIFY